MKHLEEYRQIIYLEPYLIHGEGHFLESAKCLSLAFGKFTECRIFAGKKLDAEIAEKNGIIRFFESDSEPWLFRILKNTRGLWRLCKLLDKYLLRTRRIRLRNDLNRLPYFSGKTLFFFPTASPADTVETIQYVNRYYSSCDMAFVFHTDYGKIHAALFRKMLPAIRESAEKKGNRFQLFSDSDMIISEYENQGIGNMRLLPIPHMPPPINFERALAGNGKSITIAYLGGAREEKGFQCLPGLIQALSQKEHQKTLHYMIQTSGIEILSTEYERRIMSETLAQLKKEKTAQVDLVGSMRESSDYYKMLENTDIVLLPYINIVPKRYYATSGILAEAMALGKVAVVPAETWLARQIERSGGGVIFDSPEELPQKVEEAICNYSDLQEKALQYSGIWRQFNNLDTYLTVLMEYFLPQVKTPLSTRSSNEN